MMDGTQPSPSPDASPHPSLLSALSSTSGEGPDRPRTKRRDSSFDGKAGPLHKKLQASLGDRADCLPAFTSGDDEYDNGAEPDGDGPDHELSEHVREATEEGALEAGEGTVGTRDVTGVGVDFNDDETVVLMPPKKAMPLVDKDSKLALDAVYRSPATRTALPLSPRNLSAAPVKKLGTLHVFLASCETMWGVLLFIKWGWCVGTVGLIPAWGAVLLSGACQLLAASSLSAVATNGLVTNSGGAYYMLVRSVGLGPGAAIGIMYYFGMSALMAVELCGAVDVVLPLIERSGGFILEGNGISHSSEYWTHVILTLVGLMVLVALRLFTTPHFRHILGSCVIFIFYFALTACTVGILATLAGAWSPNELKRHPDLPRPSSRQLAANLLLRNGVSFADFHSVLVFIYPSFIGIFQGSSLCSELARPFEAIPRGTFASVLTSMVLYSLLFTVVALVAPADLLREKEHLFLSYAFPVDLIGYVGAIGVGMISALACFEVAPRILQAVAEDRAVPILTPLNLGKSMDWNNEPLRAVLFTSALVLPLMFVSNIDFIAMVAAVCFLSMYTSMNFACFLQSVLQLHTWRPAFSLYTWWTALLGCFTCLFIMFYMEGIISLVAIALAVVLFVYIEIRSDTATWGQGVRGLKYHIALNALLGIEDELRSASSSSGLIRRAQSSVFRRRKPATGQGPPTPRNDCLDTSSTASHGRKPSGQHGYWRPQILVHVQAIGSCGPSNDIVRKQLLAFVAQLKATHGLTIATAVLVEKPIDVMAVAAAAAAASQSAMGGGQGVPSGSVASLMSKERDEGKALKRRIVSDMARKGVLGFVEVITASDVRQGLSMLLQLSGLGGLRPNTCVISWPDIRTIKRDCALQTLEFLARAAVHEKAVVAVKMAGPKTMPFPACTERLRGEMHIWWVVHDGGVLMLMAYLLQQHAVWRRCRLKLFTVVHGVQDVVSITMDLSQYLQALRIRADVEVVSLEAEDMGAYSQDWTVRRLRSQGPDPPVAPKPLRDLFTINETTAGDTSAEVPVRLSVPASGGRAPASVTGPLGLDGEGNGSSSGNSHGTQARGQKAAATSSDDGHVKIRRAIIQRSSDAALVLINLPPPPKVSWLEPISYFQTVEYLTAGLARVVFVYGSGAECALTELI